MRKQATDELVGPRRYCSNPASPRFIRRDDMEAAGYESYLNQVEGIQ